MYRKHQDSCLYTEISLVYRLEKIYKLTGLDLRKFDQAIVFKVAMMVHKVPDFKLNEDLTRFEF